LLGRFHFSGKRVNQAFTFSAARRGADTYDQRLYQATVTDTAGRSGMGLGLYLAKELVTRQGGKIWVTNAPQKGSHFFFTVPIFHPAIGRPQHIF
jgi:K+-sensing histidine kinase KdpD